ncbi:MAG: DUF4276 family protein [Limisphaerales bacterium]
MLRLASIVEGHGEVEAVPILIRRIARMVDPTLFIRTDPVLRVPSSRLLKSGEIERHVELAARKNAGLGGVLILLDCDDGCPAKEGPALLARAQGARPGFPVSVVLAQREFESWFLAAAESLRGRRGLPPDLAGPSDPESIRGAKEWLRARMPRDRSYAESIDQPKFTDAFDIDQARCRARSFDRCHREIVRLLKLIRDDGV